MIIRVDDKGEIIREGQQIDIGGNEKYLSLCRKHFHAGVIKTS
jgi:thymidine kinase